MTVTQFLAAGKVRVSTTTSYRAAFLAACLCAITLAPQAFGQGAQIAQVAGPAGATSAAAVAINNHNAVVGNYTDSSNATNGFSYVSGKYTKIVFPGSKAFTRAGAINDSATIVGDFLGSDNFYHGYILNGSTYTQYDVSKGVLSTSVFGINNAGTLVGTVGNEGFININGTVTLFYAVANNNSTFTYAINNSNQAVGEFIDPSNTHHGFFRDSNGQITQLDFPASTLTVADGINDHGEITGWYNDSAATVHGFTYISGKFQTSDLPGITGLNNAGTYLGFYYAAPFVNGFAHEYGYIASPVKFKFTTLQAPKAQATSAFDVNDSEVFVGVYTDSTGVSHGLQATAKTLKNIDDPNAMAGTTSPEAINLAGTIVGYYTNSSSNPQAFQYKAGKFTDLGPAGATQSAAYGINDSGEISGLYVDASGNQHGFLFNGTSYVTLDVPGAVVSLGWGVNNSGTVAMQWVDAASEFESAIYSGGKYTVLDVPGFIGTGAHGINKDGEVVFSVVDLDGNPHGAVLKGGTYYFFDDPAGVGPRAIGVNDNGLIVGRFSLANGNFAGFDATF